MSPDQFQPQTPSLILLPLIFLGVCLGMVWFTMLYERLPHLKRWWAKKKKIKHKKRAKLRLVVNNHRDSKE